MKNLGAGIFTFLSAVILFNAPTTAQAIELSDCGRVIGHEMGLWEFLDLSPNPGQVDRVLKSSLKFVKISLRKSKDDVWMVNHDPTRNIYLSANDRITVTYADETWPQMEKWREMNPIDVPLFRLEDYISRDQGKLCWFFSPKDDIDDALVQTIHRLGIANRTVILTTGLSEVQLLASYPLDWNLHFNGRVGNSSDLPAFEPYYSRMWAMEIEKSSDTQNVVNQLHQAGVKAYVDSMGYSWNYELFGTACEKVFAMGVDYSQSNRPIQCTKDMKF